MILCRFFCNALPRNRPRRPTRADPMQGLTPTSRLCRFANHRVKIDVSCASRGGGRRLTGEAWPKRRRARHNPQARERIAGSRPWGAKAPASVPQARRQDIHAGALNPVHPFSGDLAKLARLRKSHAPLDQNVAACRSQRAVWDGRPRTPRNNSRQTPRCCGTCQCLAERLTVTTRKESGTCPSRKSKPV